MPKLIRLLIVNLLIGFGISALFLAVILALDVAGLRHLMRQTPTGWLTGFAFFFLHGIVLVGVQLRLAVMRLSQVCGFTRSDTSHFSRSKPVLSRIFRHPAIAARRA